MQLIRIEFVLLVLVVYAVSSFQFPKLLDEQVDSEPLPFEDEIVEVFHAFSQNNIGRMEKIFNFLENIDPDEFNKLNDSNLSTSYTEERINYVVSF